MLNTMLPKTGKDIAHYVHTPRFHSQAIKINARIVLIWLKAARVATTLIITPYNAKTASMDLSCITINAINVAQSILIVSHAT